MPDNGDTQPQPDDTLVVDDTTYGPLGDTATMAIKRIHIPAQTLTANDIQQLAALPNVEAVLRELAQRK